MALSPDAVHLLPQDSLPRDRESVQYNRPLHILLGDDQAAQVIRTSRQKGTDNNFLSRLGSRLSQSRTGVSASSPHEDHRSRAEAECGGASASTDFARVEGEPVGSVQIPAGWVVDGENHVFRRRRYLPAMNRVDQTSMVAFRNPSGHMHGGIREARPVRYECAVTLFTNFGLGGRFLVPAASRHKAIKVVEWVALNLPTSLAQGQLEAAQEVGRAWQWVLRLVRAGGEEGGEEVRLGDTLAIESALYPGHFLCVREGRVVLAQGQSSSAHFQLGGVSLRFALQLDPRLRRSASRDPRGGSDEAEACSGFLQLPPLGWDSLTAAATWSLPPAADNALDASSSPRRAGAAVVCGSEPGGGASMLEAMLPVELLSAILRFFRCDTYSPSSPRASSCGLAVRRDATRSLLSVRGVNRLLSCLATAHVPSLRLGDLDDLPTARQRQALLHLALRCRGLRFLSLRNLDSLTDEDVACLHCLRALRSLNLGGCVRLTDACLETVARLSLVSLNLAMTRITDEGLAILAAPLAPRKITTLTFYGVMRITEDGVIYLCQRLPALQSLNLRGTRLSHEAGQRIRASCMNPECQVLTGAAIQSVYVNALPEHTGDEFAENAAL